MSNGRGFIVAGAISFILGGCAEPSPLEDLQPQQASQESAGPSDAGTGVFELNHVEVEGFLRDGDVLAMIRSFAPDECSAIDATSPIGERGGFSWNVFLILPRELEVGSRFAFTDDTTLCEGPECVVATIDTTHRYPDDPDLDWVGGGSAGCSPDDPDDTTVHIEVLERDDAAITIQLENACVLDWDGDVPTSYRLDGLYRLALCSQTP